LLFSIEGKIALRKLKSETAELEYALVLELVNKDQNMLMINWTRLVLVYRVTPLRYK